MFERRLKLLLLVLLFITGLLITRALWVQVVHHRYWTNRGAGLLRTTTQTETTRGRIFDFTGTVVLAEDIACTDACVDYRAIITPADPAWLGDVAIRRLRARLGNDWRKASREDKKALKEAEIAKVNADIESMWQSLAELYQRSDDDPEDPRACIEQIRHQIIQRVEMRRRWVWYNNFQRTITRVGEEPAWKRWLSGQSGDGPDIDSFAVTVGDQESAHVILRAIDSETAGFLGKRLEQFPGLVLRASTHRVYPQKNVACHALGHLRRVTAADLEMAREQNFDESKQYLPNDLAGGDGIEKLCEPLLRGRRGRIDRQIGDGAIVAQNDFENGRDVHITIDADLQREVQDMLKHIHVIKSRSDTTPGAGLNMHAAAVVIDVPTGQLRVLASNPDFDLNDLDDHYAALIADHLNDPLRNRATCDEFEPGSTVKPLMGLAATTEGVVGPLEGIECTGYLMLDVNGHRQRQASGRCWVASEFAAELATMNPPLLPIHHLIPFQQPHVGHDGNADGSLTVSDAIERSCNVFFETVADRLGPVRVADWYDRFGIGRVTGIGITERRGLRPDVSRLSPATGRMTNCFAGIGQGHVWATPLQVANIAATVARGGIWVRPRLLPADAQFELDAVQKRPGNALPEKVDLHVSPAGLQQVKLGMMRVVNNPPSGTGETARRSDLLVAGKTGSAEAARIWVKVVDQDGRTVLDPATRKPMKQPLAPSTRTRVNPDVPWYRSTDEEGKTFVHAWFMGFAPADNPQLAFCVLIEYAGDGGGPAAGPVVANLLEACAAHGYLHATPNVALAK